ncbi:hypothetical protein Amme_457_008 [Acidomonas methanolica NBRC 104435]|uniref:Uncharacterized protein n=1 Tax=Acidomonas methanolica NBRC 104435 TaxID=1231351 RepID=A0A023DAN6_ACIMT|nr:hypothetical protein Amme_457_008 [Acidomonas methanolica NBRC 104435]GEL00679.1 hypothetical protein AME01nite_31770 [Acidomonas methanolica NBRC 104435]
MAGPKSPAKEIAIIIRELALGSNAEGTIWVSSRFRPGASNALPSPRSAESGTTAIYDRKG